MAGVYISTFDPLHQGHVREIIEASTLCKELIVVILYDEEDEIPHQIRLRWIRLLTKAHPHIKSFSLNKQNLTDIQLIDYLYEMVSFDRIFVGREDVYEHPHAQIVYLKQDVTVTSKQIKEEGVYKHWDYIPSIVKPYFIKKVMILGTESSGKTTLVTNLAHYYNTNYVSEYGREICEAMDGYEEVFTEDLFAEIVYVQKQRELDALKQANKLLFIDTDALITKYFHDIFTNNKPNSLFEAVNKNSHYDLWLFLEPDIEWVEDEIRSMGDGQIRIENNKHLKFILDENRINYKIINGSFYERLNKAMDYVEQLLK